MGAKEYFDKYKNKEFNNEIVKQYIDELNNDLEQAVTSRGEKTIGNYAVVVKEINRKHNEVMALFEADNRPMPLMEDAFAIYWRMMSPSIKAFV